MTTQPCSWQQKKQQTKTDAVKEEKGVSSLLSVFSVNSQWLADIITQRQRYSLLTLDFNMFIAPELPSLEWLWFQKGCQLVRAFQVLVKVSFSFQKVQKGSVVHLIVFLQHRLVQWNASCCPYMLRKKKNNNHLLWWSVEDELRRQNTLEIL